MEGQELKDGKARVRRVLIDPLITKGMERKRGMTVQEHEAFLAGLEARLAYLPEDLLGALAETVERHAGGKLKNLWPREISICNWARSLMVPPAGESQLVRSFLQSDAGIRARRDGYLLELFWFLKRFGRPPLTFDYDQMKRDAETHKLRLDRARVAGASARGALPSEVAWCDRYRDQLQRCLEIVKAGENKERAA